jgi:hypothetical protein
MLFHHHKQSSTFEICHSRTSSEADFDMTSTSPDFHDLANS